MDFVYRTPVWIIVDKSKNKPVFGTSATKGKFLFVFTDENLGERFLNDSRKGNCTTSMVPTDEDWHGIVIRMKRDGFEHVAFDLDTKGRGRWVPVQDIIDNLKSPDANTGR